MGGCRGTASACPAANASPTGKPRHRRGRPGRVPPSRSTSSALPRHSPRTACQLIPPGPAECSHRHGDGRRSIDTSAKCPPGRQLNEWPGPVSCPRPGTAVQAQTTEYSAVRPDGDRVTIHGEDISVEPGRDAPLAVPALAPPPRSDASWPRTGVPRSAATARRTAAGPQRGSVRCAVFTSGDADAPSPLQQAIKVDRDLRRGLVRLPGLARMPPNAAKRAPARALRYPTKTPQVRVPSMFPTRIPRINGTLRHTVARLLSGPGAATVLAAAAARALVAGLCAGRQ